MNLTGLLLQVQAEPVHKAAEEFKIMDPTGIGMTVIAMTVVFIVLAIIYLVFKYFSKLYAMEWKKKSVDVSSPKVEMHDVQSEVSAAIGMAVHLYTSQQHDLDSLTLTINTVSRRYSPWSSKIYTLRQLPR